jgi:3-isopropylmalate/(R)-2-methylmalate dehydratase small subunit
MAGKVWKYGDNVDTDVIIPARYLNVFDGAELATHCMEDIDATFAGGVKPGDVIVAGANFGCGSSREHAPIAIKAAGVGCVIARSFARIFYRSAINIGLPIMECPEAVERIKAGDEVRINLASGEIVDIATGETFRAAPYPESMMEIMRAGGLIDYVRAKVGKA